MNPDTILRKEDCEVARTPEELIAWIEGVHDRFGADDAAREYSRMGKGLTKVFHEEIMPLGYLARHKYLGMPSLYLRPKIGNQHYDAEIIDRSSSIEHMKLLEFTSTYRSHDLALREELLAKQEAVVPMSGWVWRDGTKASGGKIHAVLNAEDHQDVLNDMVAAFETAVADKLGKAYLPGTILAVVFDDDRLYPEDVSSFQTRFRNALSKQISEKFSTIFIIGRSGRIVWEYGETDF